MRKTLAIMAVALLTTISGEAFSQSVAAAAATAEATATETPVTEEAPAAQPPLEDIAPSYDEDFGLAEEHASQTRGHSAFGEDETMPAETANTPETAPPADAASPEEAAIPAVEWAGEPQTPE